MTWEGAKYSFPYVGPTSQIRGGVKFQQMVDVMACTYTKVEVMAHRCLQTFL
jgi:hypothetical protein